MLTSAVDERRQRYGHGEELTASVGSNGEVSCELTVHPARDHNLVKEMRDEGELHALLQRVAGIDALVTTQMEAGTAPAESATILADGFVGFHDCGDL